MYTDQPKKKMSFFAFRHRTPLARKKLFRGKKKVTYFVEGFLRAISRTKPRKFAQKLREMSRWAGKDLRFIHEDSED